MARITVLGQDGGRTPPIVRWIAPGLLLLAALVLSLTSWFQIESDAVGVVTRFGKFARIEEPGLHWKLPLGVERVDEVAVKHVNKAEFGFRTAEVRGPRTRYDDRNFPDESRLLTGDLNAADVEWIVQYRITDPKNYLFRVRDPDNTLSDLARAVMGSVVGDHSVLEVLTEGRRNVNEETHAELQKLVDLYEMGMTIETVQLQNVLPPEKVRASFNDVNQAEQERARTENEAWQEYNKTIPLAEGESLKVKQQAEGYAIDRVNRATGETARFLALLAEYKKAPDVTRRRLWLETVARVLPKLGRKIVVDDDLKGVLPLFTGPAENPAAPAGGGGK
jgi:membrane protease subunit HflK